MRELPKAYDPSAIEKRWAEYWLAEKLFAVPTPQTAPPAPEKRFTFVLLLPPPNVTGRLHMGHMLNQTEMDIIIRWHRMRGDLTLWVPGTDHAGIATQMMVERQLAAEGVSRQKLGREKFVERVWRWREEYGGAILEQMKRLGVSVDWSRDRFTMDPGLSRSVVEAFVRLHAEGLIWTTDKSRYLLEYSKTKALPTRNTPFRAEFVRLEISAPEKKVSLLASATNTQRAKFSGLTHIKRDAASGDVWLGDVPMVDQAKKATVSWRPRSA